MFDSSGLRSTHFNKSLRFEWVHTHSFCVNYTVRVGLTPLVLCELYSSSGPRPTRSNQNFLFEEAQASRPPVPTSRRTAVSPALPALPFERGFCSLHFFIAFHKPLYLLAGVLFKFFIFSPSLISYV